MAKKVKKYPNLIALVINDETLEDLNEISKDKEWSLSQVARHLICEQLKQDSEYDGKSLTLGG